MYPILVRTRVVWCVDVCVLHIKRSGSNHPQLSNIRRGCQSGTYMVCWTGNIKLFSGGGVDLVGVQIYKLAL